jgi:uncharacterized repeat protein (TIGR03803 family)
MPATGWLKRAGLQRASLLGFALALLAALSVAPAFAGETVLHSFAPSYLNGSGPGANPCLGPGGMFYGNTGNGGSGGAGVVYRVDRAGHEAVLYNFTGGADGGNPSSAVLCDSAGNLYGTTPNGGSGVGYNGFGVVFRIDGAGHESVLHTFTGGADGGYPYTSLIQDSAGNLYGTTTSGGSGVGYNGFGVVFKLDRHGNETVLYSFTGGADGGFPFGGVIQDPAGNFYGVAEEGGSYGNGVVFKLDRLGNETVLYNFTGGNDGLYPSGVIRDSAGNLYGTTYNGGTAGAGVVFKLDPTGNETVLHNFTGGADGGYPSPSSGSLVMDSAGNLYGATSGGGSSGPGVVFKVDPSGDETVLYNFTGGKDGAYPQASVVRDSAGNLYGTTSNGGPAGIGTLFELNPAGHETVLYGFVETGEGNSPQAGVVQDWAGNLYGTTNGGGTYNAGTVYKIDPDGRYRTLYNFTGGNDGGNPYGGVILGWDGNLYGVAGGAGPSNAGLVYKLDLRGHEAVLYSFTGGADGASPNGVVMDGAGNLYGTTMDGGSSGVGVVFKVDPSGHETALHTFTGPDGRHPYAGVTLDLAGNIYGTTFFGGSSGVYGGLGAGVVYKIDSNGNYSLLHNFTFGPDGGLPWGDLILDWNGNLYGTTWSGGPPSGDYPGVVFKIDGMGNFSTLYTFTGFSDGGGSRSNVVLDSAGNLYGTTEYGGIGYCSYFGCGVVFELNPSGQQTVLYSFSGGIDGSEPGTGLIRDAAGNLYGTTSGGGANYAGAVYKVTPGGDSPAQLQAGERSFKLSDFGPKHPLPWDVPKSTQLGICRAHMPPTLALACRQGAR